MIQPQCFNNCTVCNYPGRPKFASVGGRWVWMKKVPAMWIAGRRRFSDLRSTLFGGLVVVTCAPLAAAGSDLATPFLITVPRSPAEAARVAAITLPTTNFTSPEPFEANPAGAATAPAQMGAQQRSQPFANLSPEQGIDFIAGQGLFRKIWVASPASTLASDGLGPLFNARSCEACHAGGGRGHPAAEGGKRSPGLVLRLAVPVAGAAGATEISSYLAEPSAPLAPTRPHPVYGAQLQDFSTQGQQAEYQLSITYHDIAVDLADGETISLRDPTYSATDLAFGPLEDGTLISARIAPQVIGLGLLEAIAPADILAHADPGDADKDGISGRAQMIWSADLGRPALGRFGHKAGVATIREQSARAFHADIGISTPLFPAGAGDCTSVQTRCMNAPDGTSGTAGATEIGEVGLDLVTFYASTLTLPARRGVARPDVLRGKQIFYETGCTACHTPKFVTDRLPAHPERSFQLIWPYTDLLLHDMGPDLADDLPEGVAAGNEWRTAPLWGIGVTADRSGRQSFLHDGRARTLLEAILWHGGEAGHAKNRVTALPSADRAALIHYLESL